MEIRNLMASKRRKKAMEKPLPNKVVAHAYFYEKDMPLYVALAKKYPSKRYGAANLTAFIRAHADEILAEENPEQ